MPLFFMNFYALSASISNTRLSVLPVFIAVVLLQCKYF
jgi:hypothetical protein